MNSKSVVGTAGFFLIVASAFAEGSQSFTGTIGDVACGKRHMMLGMSPQSCARMCVKAGSDFALIVDDKVYTLRGDKAAIDKFAGESATVKGKLSGNVITMESIQAAQSSCASRQHCKDE